MSRRRSALLFFGALGVIVVLATVVTQFTSDQPDGLEFVAEQNGFADQAERSALSGSPLSGYGGAAPASAGRNVALSGVVGVAVTVVVGFGVLWLARADRRDRSGRAGT